MKWDNWTTVRLDTVLPSEFFQLIEDNKSHIENTFPITLFNCSTIEKTTSFLEMNKKKERDEDGYYFYIRNQETQKLIGYVCIKNVNKAIMKCELAYFIDQNFEGQGIVSKAVLQTIDFCFHELMMNKVFICTSKINAASQRVATKYGFQQEGILREEFKNGKGILEDIVYFGLLKSEYKHHEK